MIYGKRKENTGGFIWGRTVFFEKMSILSILAIPATLIEYYFTKERVTEENISEDGEDKAEEVPFGKQIKACFSNKYWLIIMGFFGLCQLFQFISTNSTFAVMAQIAESLDHIEWKNGFRADGFSASVYSILITVTAGIAQSVIIGGVSLFGYISPADTAEVINQPAAVQSFFT